MNKVVVKTYDVYDIEGSLLALIAEFSNLKATYPEQDLLIEAEYERVPYSNGDDRAVITIYYNV